MAVLSYSMACYLPQLPTIIMCSFYPRTIIIYSFFIFIALHTHGHACYCVFCRCRGFHSILSNRGTVLWASPCAYVSHRAMAHSTSEAGRLIRTIKEACKTDNSTAAFEAFSQLCAMDYSMNTDILNSLLRVSATAGDEDAFKSIIDLMQNTNHISKQNIVTQSVVITGLCDFGHSEQALEFCRSLETNENLLPRLQALQAVLRASIASGLSEGVSYALTALQSRHTLP